RTIAGSEVAGGGVKSGDEIFAGAKTVRHGHNGFHPGQNLVPVLRITRSLPLRHPIADEGKPVGAHSKSRGKLWVFWTRRIGEAHGIVMHNGIFRLQRVAHDVASALVGGEVIVITTERGLPDSGFLRAIAPVGNAVPCAEAHHGAEMIAVHFASVPRHRLSHAK